MMLFKNEELKMNVAVLLSTYNGEKYLETQIQSLLEQSYSEFKIFIRDDGSSDDTMSIIKSYINSFPDKFYLKTDSYTNLGPAKSFMHLLKSVTADYYFFCDQDDKWDKEKIEKSLNEILLLETKYPNHAILVHCDAEIVDNNLNIIYPSLWKQMRIHPERLDNKQLLPVCCTVTGCTMVINNQAKIISLDMPLDADMHDSWIAYKVSQQGIVKPLNYRSMLYRQHASNAVGILGVGNLVRLKKIANLKNTLKTYYIKASFYSRHGYGSIAKWFFYKLIFLIIR